MVVKVKQQSNKRKLVKFLAFLAFVVLVVSYYLHMSEKYEMQEMEIVQQKDEKSLQEKRAEVIERIIFNEAQVAVDLLLQEKIRTVRVIGRKLYIATDPDTSLDALMVRYGVGALVKASANDIKIAIDLNQIVESKYDGQSL